MTKIHGIVYIIVGIIIIASVQYFSQVREEQSLNIFTYIGGLMILFGAGKIGINALRKRSEMPKMQHAQKSMPRGRFCPQCGLPQHPHAQFCYSCGARL